MSEMSQLQQRQMSLKQQVSFPHSALIQFVITAAVLLSLWQLTVSLI